MSLLFAISVAGLSINLHAASASAAELPPTPAPAPAEKLVHLPDAKSDTQNITIDVYPFIGTFDSVNADVETEISIRATSICGTLADVESMSDLNLNLTAPTTTPTPYTVGASPYTPTTEIMEDESPTSNWAYLHAVGTVTVKCKSRN